jgi:Ca2+-binding EF-hand superfamily protein
MKALPFLIAAAVAGSSAWADDKDSAARGSSPEKSRMAGGVSVDLMKEFESLDANKDGFIDRRELASKPDLVALFEKADKNRDGKLDPAEYQVVKAEKGSKGGE